MDNRSLRQLTGNDIFLASSDLRKLCNAKMLQKMGAGSATYYVKGKEFPAEIESELGGLDPELGGLAPELGGLDPTEEEAGLAQFPENLQRSIANLGQRAGKETIPIVIELCRLKSFSAAQIASYLGRKDVRHLTRTFLRPLIESGELGYTFPNEENHPKQAYRTLDTP